MKGPSIFEGPFLLLLVECETGVRWFRMFRSSLKDELPGMKMYLLIHGNSTQRKSMFNYQLMLQICSLRRNCVGTLLSELLFRKHFCSGFETKKPKHLLRLVIYLG